VRLRGIRVFQYMQGKNMGIWNFLKIMGLKFWKNVRKIDFVSQSFLEKYKFSKYILKNIIYINK
jgi:hypothetical protein